MQTPETNIPDRSLDTLDSTTWATPETKKWQTFDPEKSRGMVDMLKINEFISELEEAAGQEQDQSKEEKDKDYKNASEKRSADLKKFADAIKETRDINTKVEWTWWGNILSYLINQSPNFDYLLDKALQMSSLDINESDSVWETPLTQCIHTSGFETATADIDIPTMEKLLKHKNINVNIKNKNWETALTKIISFLTNDNVWWAEDTREQCLEAMEMIVSHSTIDREAAKEYDMLAVASDRNPQNKEYIKRAMKILSDKLCVAPQPNLEPKQGSGVGDESDNNK